MNPNQIYPIDSRVKITDTRSFHVGKEGLIKDFNIRNEEYFIVGSTFSGWYDLSEFYPVSGPSKQALNNIFAAQSPTWVINPTDYGAIVNTPVFRNSRCNHTWKSIQLAITTVYNCEKCDMKKEDYDKEQEDIF